MNSPKIYGRPILSKHVSIVRILILLALAPTVVAALLVLMAVFTGRILPLAQASAAIPAAVMFLVFVTLFVIGVFRISNPRILRGMQSLLLVLLVCSISFWSQDMNAVGITAGMIAASLIFMWSVNQLPGPILALFLSAFCCGSALFLVPNIMEFEQRPSHDFFFNLQSQMRLSFAWFSLAMVLFACAYFPRRLELKRYFGIYPVRRTHTSAEKKPVGFTLIEILICLAIMGIIAGGILSGWRYCLHQQRELYHRAQIQEILSSELNEILTGKEIPPVGTEVRDLPILLSAFGEHPDLSGGYTVSETDEEGIVRIQVSLTQYMENSVSRRFELVGYRHIAGGES
ncbi:MAG TPA: type II secretion system protein [bacterium]|mgnify:CR=1 FL=1|nr:type II secretion system protein [bacterium]HQO34716.1 type II secretion system protein [bacterium]HQP99080.1 type II secretion system protein [bacterium]